MTARDLVRDARAAGVRLAVVDGKLQGAYPKSAPEWFGLIRANAADVVAVLTNTCAWCDESDADGGLDAGGRPWCVACRDTELHLQSDMPALLIVNETRQAWEAAMLRIGAAVGFPAVQYSAAFGVAPGEAHWMKFTKHASIDDLAAVHYKLRELVENLPQPGQAVVQ